MGVVDPHTPIKRDEISSRGKNGFSKNFEVHFIPLRAKILARDFRGVWGPGLRSS